MQREDKRQGTGGGRVSGLGGGGGARGAAEAEEGGAGLGVGLEGLRRRRQRWAVSQAELKRPYREGQGREVFLRLTPCRRRNRRLGQLRRWPWRPWPPRADRRSHAPMIRTSKDFQGT